MKVAEQTTLASGNPNRSSKTWQCGVCIKGELRSSKLFYCIARGPVILYQIVGLAHKKHARMRPDNVTLLYSMVHRILREAVLLPQCRVPAQIRAFSPTVRAAVQDIGPTWLCKHEDGDFGSRSGWNVTWFKCRRVFVIESRCIANLSSTRPQHRYRRC